MQSAVLVRFTNSCAQEHSKDYHNAEVTRNYEM